MKYVQSYISTCLDILIAKLFVWLLALFTIGFSLLQLLKWADTSIKEYTFASKPDVSVDGFLSLKIMLLAQA